MSIESHLVSLRTYLEEVASQNKQIIGELKRTNELLAGRQAATTPSKPPIPKEAVGPVTFETVEIVETEPPPDAFIAAVTQKVDTSKSKSPVEVTPETTKPDFTVTVEDEPRGTKKPAKGGKPGAKPGKPGGVTPQVNWNS